MSTQSESDKQFIGALEASIPHVKAVADWLRSLGLSVTVPETHIRPSFSDRAEFSDNGDLYVAGIGRVEVKQRKLEFNSLGSFPYRSVFIANADVWEQWEVKPARYIITNIDSSGCIVVRGDTSPHWLKESIWDRTKEIQCRAIACPIQFCKYYSMR